jgi:hypothetical protein
MKLRMPTGVVLLRYLVVAVTALLVVGYFNNKAQGDKTCDAIKVMGEGIVSNHQHAIDQSNAFLKSGAYEKFFPDVPTKQLIELTKAQNARDQAEINGVNEAVGSACG